MFTATIPELIAYLISMQYFIKYRYTHYIYMFATWFFMWLGNLLLAVGYLTLDKTVYRMGVIATIPLTYFIAILLDSISRKTIDNLKMIAITIVSVLVIIFVFDEDSVSTNISKLGELGPSISGRLSYALSGLFLIAGSLWFYYSLVLFIKSPSSLKRIAGINLVGGSLGGPIAAIAFASGAVWFLPGLDYFLIGLGALFSTYSFSHEPKLGYVLPFKVSRLMIIDTDSGLPAYSYTWDNTGLADSYLFSGAIHGIIAILTESLHKGIVKEIILEQGSLILKEAEEGYPLAFVLITSKTSSILHQSLANFSTIITATIPKEKINELVTTGPTDIFEELVEKAFPYVVSYD